MLDAINAMTIKLSEMFDKLFTIKVSNIGIKLVNIAPIKIMFDKLFLFGFLSAIFPPI